MTDFTDTANNVDISTQPNLFDEHSGAIAEPKAKEEIAPAVAVALTGRHLIEASAGTGKTWTLTGIVLRLLIEARRAPEQIIATTRSEERRVGKECRIGCRSRWSPYH